MSQFWSAIIVGLAVIVIGFLASKAYHEWWLGEEDWSGNIFGTTSRFDRAIGWLPYVGLLLIASAVLWGLVAFVLSLIRA
jgi:hypothetical protein